MIMKKTSLKSYIIALIFLNALPLFSAEFSGDFMAGYKGGLGFQGNIMIARFAKGFPLNLQLGVAYASFDPGNALDARRIFINDATNGDPEKSGWNWDIGLDFLYRVDWLSMEQAFLYAGPRYSSFTGNFVFIGGNEDFDITSTQWGFGAGVKAYFAMNNKFSFVTAAGFDYYFSGDLSGHDTTYNPDGENVNPRNDYSYDDADQAINQPKFELRAMIGINYKF